MGEDSERSTKLNVPDNFFQHVKYYLIGNVDNKISNLLQTGGAKHETYLSEMVTHAICDDDQEDEYTVARELFELPVVMGQWVTLSIKCGCLLPTNAFTPDSKKIFSGVVACPSQVSREDQKNIWALLTVHGGKCQAEFNRNVTHLVTTNTAGAKFDIATRHSDKVFIVTPDWVTESVAKGAQEDAKRYHPRLMVFDIPEKKKPPGREIIQPPSPGKSITPPPIGPPSLLTPILKSPRSETSRTKEALAKMLQNKPYTSTPRHQYPAGMYPMMPQMPLAQRGTVAPGLRGQSPRNMLRNITNDGRTPKTPKAPRSPGRAKISQLVSTLNRPPRPLSPGRYTNLSHHLQLARPSQPEVAICYGHDPNEIVPEDLCLIGCVFYITDYQKHITAEQLATWKRVIEQHGGFLDESYSNRVTHVLCEHQKSDVFQLALRDGKRLVTAHWLNDCLLQKKMVPPWLALHFPSVYAKERPASNQIEKMYLNHDKENAVFDHNCYVKKQQFICPQIICVTNFDGIERERVKSMIGAIGAKYTGYMTRANSVVVCKRLIGAKYDKASEWRVPCVNVQWLNDLMFGELHALKLPLDQKYTNYLLEDPFKIDSWRVCHLLEGWKTPIKISKETWKKFQPSSLLKGTSRSSQGSTSQRPVQTPNASSALTTLAQAHNLVNSGLNPAEQMNSTHQLTNMGQNALESATNSVNHGQNLVGLSENNLAIAEGSTPKSESQPTIVANQTADSNTVGSLETGVEGLASEGKFSVQAQGPAAPTTCDSTSDKTEHGESEGKTSALKPESVVESTAEGQGVKRKAEDIENPPEKKAKLELPSSSTENHEAGENSDKENREMALPVVLVTGLTKGKARQITSDVQKLGGRVVTSASGATHLVASSISRTVKFLTALSVVKYTVTPDWIEHSAREGRFLNEEKYTLKDELTEREFNFKLSEALKRAHQAKLFKDMTFYLTPDIYPGRALLTDIIQSASGTVTDRRPSARTIASRVNNKGLPIFVVLSSVNDLHLCADLQARNIGVHNAEFVLTGVMKQEIDFESFQMS